MASPFSSPSSLTHGSNPWWLLLHPLLQVLPQGPHFPQSLWNLNPTYVSSVQLLAVSIFIYQSEITWGQGHIASLTSMCRLISGATRSWGPALSIAVYNKRPNLSTFKVLLQNQSWFKLSTGIFWVCKHLGLSSPWALGTFASSIGL